MRDPELTRPRDLHCHIHQNLIQLFVDCVKRRSLGRNRNPAATNQISQRRLQGIWNHWTFVILAHRSAELFKLLMMTERLLTRSNLPQHNTKAVHITLLVKLLKLHHFGGHPQGLFTYCTEIRTQRWRYTMRERNGTVVSNQSLHSLHLQPSEGDKHTENGISASTQ